MTNEIQKEFGDYIEEIEDLPTQASSECDIPSRVFDVEATTATLRLDKLVAQLMPEVSRSRVQRWIEQGAVRVNGETTRELRAKAGGGDQIEVRELPAPEEEAYKPEAGIDFAVLYEDETILVIDKPAGLVVHPAAGHWSGTLLNGLLERYPELSRVPRAGIVHRLDKDTSGLMVVARTEAAQTDLVRQLQARSVTREYWAIVLGVAPEAGFVDSPIGRDPRNPLKFSCGGIASKPAKTHCRLVDTVNVAGRAISWVACRLDTGRTHQIRVHLTSVDLPLLGDPLYRTGASKLPEVAGFAATFTRQALHASRLRFVHPSKRQRVEWFTSPPEDMVELMQELEFGPLDRPVRVFD